MLSTPAGAGSSLGGGFVAHAALAWAVPKCVQWWTPWPGSKSAAHPNQRHFTSAENFHGGISTAIQRLPALRLSAYCDCAGCEGGKREASSARVRPLLEPTVFPVRMRILTKPASSSPQQLARGTVGVPPPRRRRQGEAPEGLGGLRRRG